MSEGKSPGPFGGWFGTVGGFVGLVLGYDITRNLWGGVIGLVVGAYIGLAVEHLTWKVIVIGSALLIFLIRREIVRGLIESFFNG